MFNMFWLRRMDSEGIRTPFYVSRHCMQNPGLPAGGSAGGQPPASGDQPQTVEVEIDGETLKLTKEEIAKGFLRQSDYTRKAQALVEERKSLEAERQEFEEAYGDNSFSSSYDSGEDDGRSDRAEKIAVAAAKKVSLIESRQELRRQEETLVKKYGDIDDTLTTDEGMKKVVQFALANRIPTVEKAYLAMKGEALIKEAQSKAEKDVLRRLKERAGGSLESSTSGAQGHHTKAKNYKEAMSRASDYGL